ncbi:hypothetical protein BH10PAT1_BH10PAT1_4900 [soil metagenome]
MSTERVNNDELDYENLIDLFYGYSQVLQSKGKDIKYLNSSVADILLYPFGGNTWELCCLDIETKNKRKGVVIYKRKTGSRYDGNFIVDIGQEINGKSVALKLFSPIGSGDIYVNWYYPEKILHEDDAFVPNNNDLDEYVDILHKIRP